MIVLDKKLNLFVWSLIIVSLAGKSHQDLWWKNSRIVRQGSYGNMPQPPVNPQPQRPSVPQEPQFVPTVQEQTITGISFDCSNKPTGPNKDSQYCDIYHACVFGKQEKTYGCAQNGDRFYYDETTQKCEFASKNPSGCPSGNYFTPLTQTDNQQQSMNSGYGNNNNNNNNNNFGTYGQVPSGGNNNNNNYNYQQTNFMPQTTQPVFFTQPFNQYGNQNNMGNNNNFQPSGQVEQVEPWKQYVRDNEQFSCADKPDGFYPSKWCNVYYRCFNKNKFEFLCAVMQSGDRLWWKLHSTSQSVPQPQAQCEWPCDTGRQCTSPGGILIDNGASVSESTSEAQRVLDSCPKPSGNNNNQQTGGYGQVPSGGNNNNNNNNFGTYGQVPSGGNNNNNNMGNYGQGLNGGNGQVVEDNSNDLFRIPDSENPCQGVSDGSFVADSKYCNVFHVCVKGVRKDFLCAKGSSTYELWWNDATKQCDWPCKVQCSKQIFGSSSSAAEVANMDRNLNPALCGADQGSNGNNGNQFGAYGNQFTQPPIQTLPPQTYPPQTYPPQTYPPQTYPPQTYPPQTYPPQTYPPQTQPPQTYPSYNNNNNNNYGGYGF